jgi:hypothetical protein
MEEPVIDINLAVIDVNSDQLTPPKRYTGIWLPVQSNAIATKDMKRLKVIWERISHSRVDILR